jgi:rubrerythrin
MNHSFGTADEILQYAIEKEEEAARFYASLARQTTRAGMDSVFRQFAQEEERHKAKLLSVKQGQALTTKLRHIADLKIADTLADIAPGSELGYREALILAMKREKSSFKLYSDLAARAGTAELQQLFAELAQEEAKHKLRFELEYDEFVLTQN